MERERAYLSMHEGSGFMNRFPAAQDALMSIIGSSYDGIYITDGDANTIYVNQSYQVISGLEPEDVMGVNMRTLVNGGIISKSATLLALQKKRTVTIEQDFRTGKHAVVTSTPIFNQTDQIVMVVTNVRDISELYILREELKKSNEISQKYQKQILQDADIVAADDISLKLIRMIDRVAMLDTPILLLGETGVGKERIASYIHKNSGRKNKNFIKVNCGAIAESLIESELFGYEPGSFTGANKEGKIGFFGLANEGTIFLDELGELSVGAQVKLLRVLQEQEIVRVGSNKPEKIDVRILAATNQNLEDLIEAGRFRKDLYYRLNIFPVVIPPLRRRKGDIPVLAKTALEELNRKYGKSKSFSQTAILTLLEYQWPGNVRELRNIVERAFIMSDEDAITAADLPLQTIRSVLEGEAEDQTLNLKDLLELTEYEYIYRAYKKYKNVRAAAKSIQMDPATFTRKRKKYKTKFVLYK